MTENNKRANKAQLVEFCAWTRQPWSSFKHFVSLVVADLTDFLIWSGVGFRQGTSVLSIRCHRKYEVAG